ncbi:hypothetical protein DY000_02008819 [Brassica cretica]|uniref:Uncharacterized protein n=1 Tax=Brassica cretica TaxID=69181 RepID=A0ABQ7BW16_BRACR|nr:hypothetical protein DY000_02008819 [Brassica cretica]
MRAGATPRVAHPALARRRAFGSCARIQLPALEFFVALSRFGDTGRTLQHLIRTTLAIWTLKMPTS